MYFVLRVICYFYDSHFIYFFFAFRLCFSQCIVKCISFRYIILKNLFSSLGASAMSATVAGKQIATNRHIVTQSEQFFGGFQLQISIDHTSKLNWECESCGCRNMGKAKLCGLCGALKSTYIVKPAKAHKQSLVKKQRTKLLSAKEIFERTNNHFPHWKKYKHIASKSNSAKKSKSQKNIFEGINMDNLNSNEIVYEDDPYPTMAWNNDEKDNIDDDDDDDGASNQLENV